ncbi:MAG: myo-inosose-2 dehydratase, partial [Porticoccaceae bacterium]|nr:myo-inosose-2 dehydratase [Porticoccaceae bacterium]
MSIKIGINPLTWSNDDLPALGAETSLQQCLREGRAAGFSGFELGNKFPREPAVLKPLLEQHNLSLISGWFSGQLLNRSVEEEISALQPHLDLLQAMGCKVLVYCDITGSTQGNRQQPLSRRPQLLADQWPAFGNALNRVADACLQQGIRLAYHHHMGTVVQTEAEVDTLVEHTHDSVGLLLDSGHITYAGGDCLALQQRHAQRICHVHCKDVRRAVLADALNRDLSFLDAVMNGVFTVPGDGCIDYSTLFAQLKAADYHGWLVVEAEQDPVVAPAMQYATLGADNLKALCQQAG